VTSRDETMFHSGILNKRKPSPDNLKAKIAKPLLWILPTGATVIAGLVAFFIIDHNTNLNRMEEATRILSNSEPSKYMRNNDKISQVNGRRAAILNQSGSGSKMGDKLAKDIFK